MSSLYALIYNRYKQFHFNECQKQKVFISNTEKNSFIFWVLFMLDNLHCKLFRVRKPLYLSCHVTFDSIRCLCDTSSINCKFLWVRKLLLLSSHITFDSIRCLYDISSNRNSYSLVPNEISHPYPCNDIRRNWLVK